MVSWALFRVIPEQRVPHTASMAPKQTPTNNNNQILKQHTAYLGLGLKANFARDC